MQVYATIYCVSVPENTVQTLYQYLTMGCINTVYHFIVQNVCHHKMGPIVTQDFTVAQLATLAPTFAKDEKINFLLNHC